MHFKKSTRFHVFLKILFILGRYLATYMEAWLPLFISRLFTVNTLLELLGPLIMGSYIMFPF